MHFEPQNRVIIYFSVGVIGAFPPLFELNPNHSIYDPKDGYLEENPIEGTCSSYWAYFDCIMAENHCGAKERFPMVQYSWKQLQCQCNCTLM